MPISRDDFEKRRSPRELLLFVENVRATVQTNPSESKHGICKKGLYKEFLDEILPLSHFASKHYTETYSIKPVLGNQGYDAIVYDGTNKICDYLELTNPHNGFEAAKDAKIRAKRGYGNINVSEPDKDFDALMLHVIDACNKKAFKDYSDCKLIITINPNPPPSGVQAQYEEQIRTLVAKLSRIPFKAKQVFLLIPPDRLEIVR